MRDFCPGLTAQQAHHNLKTAVRTLEQAQQNAILWFGEILERKLFRDLGYADIHRYAAAELGWSRTKTFDFIRISRKLGNLPEVKKKVASGQLGYGKAREIVAVADAKNEQQWLELALAKPKRELAKEVQRARRRAAEVKTGQMPLLPAQPGPAASPPQRVTLEMTAVQFARYEALWEQLRKLGGLPADRVEALLAVMGGCVANGPSHRWDASSTEKSHRWDARPPVQIHVHQCPDCEKATVQTSRGELVLDEAQKEQVLCDAAIARLGRRNTTTIPPAVKRQVLARDRHRCQGPGCTNTRYLEIHHITPRSRGGANALENLTTLCSGCHARAHRQPDLARESPPGYGCAGISLTDLLPSWPVVHYHSVELSCTIQPTAGSDHERSQQHRGNPGLRHRHGAESRRSVHGDRRAGPERAQPPPVPFAGR